MAPETVRDGAPVGITEPNEVDKEVAAARTTPFEATETTSPFTVTAGPPTESVCEPITRLEPAVSVKTFVPIVKTAWDGMFDATGMAEKDCVVLPITMPDGAALKTWPLIVAAGPPTESVVDPMVRGTFGKSVYVLPEILKMAPEIVDADPGRADIPIVLLPTTSPLDPTLTTWPLIDSAGPPAERVCEPMTIALPVADAV